MTALLTRPAPAVPASLARAAWIVAAVLFVAYPVLRPYGDATPDGMAAAFASPAWLVAHLAAVAGFVAVGVGLTRVSAAATAIWTAGTALVLPYYGAETFALHGLAGMLSGAQLAAAAEAVRGGPVAMTCFGAGLVLLAVAAVVTAVRERVIALPFAAAMLLFLPQFFADPALRIAHGVLLGLGCVLLSRRSR